MPVEYENALTTVSAVPDAFHAALAASGKKQSFKQEKTVTDLTEAQRAELTLAIEAKFMVRYQQKNDDAHDAQEWVVESGNERQLGDLVALASRQAVDV
jgi:hypothetical protein